MKKSLAGFKKSVSTARTRAEKVRVINYTRTKSNQIKIGKNPSPQKIGAINRLFKKTAHEAKTATALLRPKNTGERHEMNIRGIKTRGMDFVPVTVGDGAAKFKFNRRTKKRELEFTNDNFGRFEIVTIDPDELLEVGDDIEELAEYLRNILKSAGAEDGKMITPVYSFGDMKGFYFGLSYSYSNLDELLARFISDFLKYGENNVARAFAISNADDIPGQGERPDMEFDAENKKIAEKYAPKGKPKKAKRGTISKAVKKNLIIERDKLRQREKEIERKLKKIK